MPDVMIELDLTTPWEPPEPPPTPRRRRRWVALAAVALVTAGLLVAAVPRRGNGPLFTVDYQVLGINSAGGRLFLERYLPAGAGRQVEALGLRDGTPLWSRPIDLNQHVLLATDHVVALVTELPDESTTLTALDAATGEPRWQRASAQAVGRAGGRIVVEDMAGVTQEDRLFPANAISADGGAVNFPAEQRDQRYVALAEETGAPAWEVDVPKGSVVTFGWSGDYRSLASLSELSPAGLLRIRDLGAGGVTTTHQLDWSGTISGFSVEAGGAATGHDQVLIFTAGRQGADVYDLGSGQLLWHWQHSRRYAALYRCTADRYCMAEENGLAVIDARTGTVVWHVDRYNAVLRRDADAMVLSSYQQTELGEGVLATVDVRTGKIERRLADWYVVQSPFGNHLIVWRPIDSRTAVLGVVDPRSGRVRVFGRAADWYGRPDCIQDGNTLACVVVGELSVWTLP